MAPTDIPLWKAPDKMFGRPNWFRERTAGWGLVPTKWQGWASSGAWAAAGGIPALGLVVTGKVVEAVIWAGFVGLALVGEVRKIQRAINAAKAPVSVEDLLVIDEEDSTLSTRNFDMHLR